jgi:hypothetical protein
MSRDEIMEFLRDRIEDIAHKIDHVQERMVTKDDLAHMQTAQSTDSERVRTLAVQVEKHQQVLNWAGRISTGIAAAALTGLAAFIVQLEQPKAAPAASIASPPPTTAPHRTK